MAPFPPAVMLERAVFTQDDLVAPGIVAICGLNIILVALFVVGRLYSNLALSRSLHLDDCASLVATALSFTYSGITFAILVQSRSFAYDGWSTDFYSKAIFAANAIAGPTTFFAKSAVFILYFRIFGLHKWMRYAIYLGLVFSFCLYWTNVPLYTYFCAAHDGAWGASVTARCGQVSSFSVIQGVVDIGLGIYAMTIPIPAVLNLQMSKKKKAGVVFIFMHGVFALVGSVAGLYYRIRLSQSGDNSLFYQTAVMICLTVENDMTIVSSSMHPIATYLKRGKGPSRLFESLRSRLTGSTWSSSSSAFKQQTLETPSSGSLRSQGGQYLEKPGYKASRPILVSTQSIDEVLEP